jgi:outer membrane protein assembly factor BamB
MEIMDVSLWLRLLFGPENQGLSLAVIPTVLIPLTFLTVGLTSLAGMVAGWFGVKLKTEGPKQFLEVLLKKRVLISMVFLNLLGLGIYKSYIYVKNLPSFIYTIENQSNKNSISSNETYPDVHLRPNHYIGTLKPPMSASLKLHKELKLPKGSFRSGLISGNSLFYGADDGYIYEIDKISLLQIRKFFVGTQVTTRPIIYKNKLIAGEGNHDTHHARIYSFNLKTGNFIESFKTLGHTEGQPIVQSYLGQDLLFITAGRDGLYAISPNDFKEVWHKNDGHLDATVSYEDGTIYAGTGAEKGVAWDVSYAVAYEFLTGKEIWKKQLPLSNWMHPIITEKDVCYILGEIYFPSQVGSLYCLNKKSGQTDFSIPFDSPVASKPFYVKTNNSEFVYFGDLSGVIHGVNLLTKEKIWSVKTSLKTINYALSSFDYDSQNGILWYPSFDNGIFAIHPMTGEILSHWTPSASEALWKKNYAAVTVEDNRLYHMDIKGNLRMFNIYTEKLASKRE